MKRPKIAPITFVAIVAVIAVVLTIFVTVPLFLRDLDAVLEFWR